VLEWTCSWKTFYEYAGDDEEAEFRANARELAKWAKEAYRDEPEIKYMPDERDEWNAVTCGRRLAVRLRNTEREYSTNRFSSSPSDASYLIQMPRLFNVVDTRGLLR
jgi:hypothetical protein